MKSYMTGITLPLCLLLCAFCYADTVTLNQGNNLTGEIVSEKNTYIIIDVGAAVLKIPKDQISEFRYADTNEPELSASEESSQPDEPSNELYRTSKLKKTTIEKCVERISQSVVKVSTPAGSGSGFFINAQGYLITNYHVIETETRIEVTVFQKTDTGFRKKKFKKVKIEAINPFYDLALLKIEDANATEFKYAPVGDISELNIGEAVFAIGNPLGLERTVTDGVISTKNRAFEGLVYIQTNADINPGNSGGPLFNLAGEVVGVTNMGYIFFGGLGFAIPIDTVKHFVENRQAFAYDKDNPNTGFRYIQPDSRRNKNKLVLGEKHDKK